MKNYLPYLLLVLLAGITPLSAKQDKKNPNIDDFTPQQINAIVKRELTANQNKIALRVKGLICESCGIGIRKKTTRHLSIDTKKPNRGVTMDIVHMLVYFDLKKGSKPDPKAYAKVIKDAGYEAITFFSLQNGKLKRTSL